MRSRVHFIIVLGSLLACGPALADTPAAAVHAAAAPADGDVTMTVIPSGADVVKAVVQNISVPADSSKVAKSKDGSKAPAAERNAQQVAEAAGEHQAGQTEQQVQQQTLPGQIAAKTRLPPPPPPPPPPPRPPRS